MTNASTAAAAAGWAIYRVTHPRPSLDEINTQLVESGLDRVSPRTHRHYRKMERYGIESYLPINELDMRIKNGRIA